jgi:hypothetical protein
MTKEDFFNLGVGDKVVYTNTGSVWEIEEAHYHNDERTPSHFGIKCFSREMELTFENKWKFELEG